MFNSSDQLNSIKQLPLLSLCFAPVLIVYELIFGYELIFAIGSLKKKLALSQGRYWTCYANTMKTN
jgi:hypothetical protein